MGNEEKYIRIFEHEPGVMAFFATRFSAVEGRPGGTVYDNRELFSELGVDDYFKVWPRQVHGTDIAVIDLEDVNQNLSDGGVIIPETDGVITNVKKVLLTSVHADCPPVYLYDPETRSIGLVHAGWRGAAAGIVPKAIRKMQNEYGAKADDIRLFVGPGISKCCFEVGEEVAEQFEKNWGSTFAEPCGGSKYMLDLKEAIRSQAVGAGIPEENIGISEHCTCCEPSLFSSCRREGSSYMRMGAGIAI